MSEVVVAPIAGGPARTVVPGPSDNGDPYWSPDGKTILFFSNRSGSGDLWVTVGVAPHEMFGRKGRNLTLTVPISFAEAALGAEVTVPTLDGTVVLRVPPGTPSGRTFRVKGRGVADGDGSKAAGDLLVTVEVAVPTKLSPAEREAIEALATASTESPRTRLGV